MNWEELPKEIQERYIKCQCNNNQAKAMSETDNTCFSCKHCDLYENENVRPSTTHICNLTDEFISDIEENYCEHQENEL